MAQDRLAKKAVLCRLTFTLLVCLPLGAGSVLHAESGPTFSLEKLEQSFEEPPPEARPRVWWHWMGGNVTEAGITRDLEWMSRAGLGGAQIFNVELQTPQVVPPVRFGEARWQGMIRHAVEVAQKVQLELGIAASPGWSETGGPWVTPAQAMKKLVWSEIELEGGRAISVTLPKPPDLPGPFQNKPALKGIFVHSDAPVSPAYYEDVRVVAFPVTSSSTITPRPAALTSAGPVDASLLWDNDHTSAISISTVSPGPPWLIYRFDEPISIRSATLSVILPPNYPGALSPPAPELQVSSDGVTYRPVAQFELTAPQNSISFAPATGRFFRLQWPKSATVPNETANLSPNLYPIAEFTLSQLPRIHRFEEKAGFAAGSDLVDAPTPPVARGDTIALHSVVDISDRMDAEGLLNWFAPPGRWVVQRFGWSLTGSMNGPATAAATGLEVDKLNRRHVRSYLEDYLDHFPAKRGADGIRALMLDSYEAGQQNWTDDMLAKFAQRNGYSLVRWLPTLTGRIMNSSESSDRVLWDFRQTLGALIAEEHYGEIAAFAQSNNMELYGEAHESHRAFVGDGIDAKRHATVPTSAIWVGRPTTPFEADIRESASVAHVYGQNIVAAESFTASDNPYGFDPGSLKKTADIALASGLNRFIIHTSVHQPTERKPGLGLGRFGQWFTRHETWAEDANAWVNYLARSSYLLQQGVFQADIAYFYGEDSNVTTKFGKRLPDIPSGYAYDFVNAHGLNHALKVEDGQLVASSGTRYRVLAIDPTVEWMTVGTLRRIVDLASQGIIVTGDRPKGTPSATDDQAEFDLLADYLWPSTQEEEGLSIPNIYCARCLDGALSENGIVADVLTDSGQVEFVHRRLFDGHIYFVREASGNNQTRALKFKVSGMVPEIWNAVDGKIYRIAFEDDGEATTVFLPLGRHSSAFVVFREKGPEIKRDLFPSDELKDIILIEGDWALDFGGRQERLSGGLVDWTASEDRDLRYFSGTATYRISFDLPVNWKGRDGRRSVLDLGQVGNLASVRLNGIELGVVWNPPYRLDVTGKVLAGRNLLEIEVTNLWRNRMIGDVSADPEHQRTWASYSPFSERDPLIPSGLVGPVVIGVQD